MAALKPLSFASAFKKALVWSVPDPVQDMPDGDASLNRVTDMRTSVRGKEDLLNRDQGGVPNLFNREHINSDSPIELLERIKIDKPEWFQDTFNGEIFPIPNSGRGSVRNFNTVKVDRSERMVALSKLLEKGHLVLNEGGTTLLVREQTDPDSTAQLGIKKYPRVLIIQVDLTEPYNTNNILPNNIMKIGQSQEYQLRSIIQTYKTSGHYIVLSTTHDEDVYSKTCNEGQTNYINVCSDERSLHEDYIYIYQETSNPTKITAKNGEMHNKDFQSELLEAQSNLPQSGQSSILIREAIQNATNHGVNLSSGTSIKSDGNCMFSAAIGNINTRKCFDTKINLTPSQARELWLNDTHDIVREFAGEDEADFEIQWNALKYAKIYETKLGDFVMPAIAHTLKHNILIFNTKHMNAHDPIAVVRADQIAGAKAISDIPLVLAYDGTHYEHLIPNCDSDVAKTCELVNKYTLGTYSFNWDIVPPSSYAQALKQNISMVPVIISDFGTLTNSSHRTPTKRPYEAHNDIEEEQNKQCPPKVSKDKKHTTSRTSVAHQCVLNLKNRFSMLEEETFQIPTKQQECPEPDFEFIQTSQNRTKKNLKHRSSLKKYSNKHNLADYQKDKVKLSPLTIRLSRKSQFEARKQVSKGEAAVVNPTKALPISNKERDTMVSFDHPYSNRYRERTKIPNQINTSKGQNTDHNNLYTDHSYTFGSNKNPQKETPPNHVQRRGLNGKTITPPDNTGDTTAGKKIPDYLGSDWNKLRQRKSTNLTVGSINIRGLGRVKQVQLADMCELIDIDILATTEHHRDTTEFRGTLSKNNKSMRLRGFNNISTHRPAQKRGGISWHWKKNLNIDSWEGAELPEHLIPHATERCWIKVICSTGTWYLCAVYMPTENGNQEKLTKYAKILQILDLDLAALEDIDAPSILFGDFNSHIGADTNRYGVTKNHASVGKNGNMLHNWLEKWDKVIVNSHPITDGTWTWSDGKGSRSILDLMIMDKNLINFVDALIIDDKREVTTINSDHNLMVTALNTGYARIKWASSKPKTWNFDTLDKNKYCAELKQALKLVEPETTNVDDLNKEITEKIRETLQKTAEVNKRRSKPPTPPDVKELEENIRKRELQIYDIQNKIQTFSSNKQKMKEKIKALKSDVALIKNEIDLLLNEKLKAILQFEEVNNTKMRKAMRTMGKNSSKYWSVIKDADTQSINTLRNSKGKLATSRKETLNVAFEYFQNLFKAKTDNNPAEEVPTLGIPKVNMKNSKTILNRTNKREILKILKTLKNRKAAGPDGLPNEAFKLGAEELVPYLVQLYNMVLSNLSSPLEWNIGIMHLIYKGKGDINDLTNYRGITVNNAISKIFTTLINNRLSPIIEKSGILGNIQQGGRPGKRSTDSLFILRTIIEKSLKSGKIADRDIALIFIDLSKAYDCVPHQKLWDKLLALGMHLDIIKLLTSLYKDSRVKVMVNGFLTDDVQYQQGIKQGCVLSPILFILYIADLGHLLESHKGGIKLQGLHIAGLLYVDDLILIGRNSHEVNILLSQVQALLENLGMSINCAKSNILSCKEAEIMMGTSLLSTSDEMLGYINRSSKYKYLGVQITTASTIGVFKEATKACKQKLKSQAGIILGLASNDFDPIKNGLTLWSGMAVVSALYGAEVIQFKQDDIRELEAIQGAFLAHLLGQRSSVSHPALRKETGIKPISQIITNMKINYWHHITKSPKDSWLEAAFLECFKQGQDPEGPQGWTSSYAQEIKVIKENSKIYDPTPTTSKNKFKRIAKDKIAIYFKDLDEQSISSQRMHSLRSYPKFKDNDKPQSYLLNTKKCDIITSFRLGDAGLGNRSKHPVKFCPMCKTGVNTEAHLVFQCPSVQHIRDTVGMTTPQDKDINSMLQQFLTCSNISPSETQKKAELLEELLNYHNDVLDKSNINPASQDPLMFLSEECDLCNFSSHTTRGVKIHKGKMHKNQL